MTSKVSQFQLEFMLETMNQYSAFNFAKRRDRASKIQKIIDETVSEQPKKKPEAISRNKTYERIMNEPLNKN